MSIILTIILLTLTPALELRAAIPYGILNNGFSWLTIFFIASLVNILLGIILYFIYSKIIKLFLFIKPLEKYYHKTVEKTQKKIAPFIDKYGKIGLALFIGLPWPGSGVYTGTLAAYLLGYKYKDYLISMSLGVFLGAAIVTTLTLSGVSLYNFILGLF